MCFPITTYIEKFMQFIFYLFIALQSLDGNKYVSLLTIRLTHFCPLISLHRSDGYFEVSWFSWRF